MPRASNAKEALEEMATWIKEKHEGDLGIVYCLSQKVRVGVLRNCVIILLILTIGKRTHKLWQKA